MIQSKLIWWLGLQVFLFPWDSYHTLFYIDILDFKVVLKAVYFSYLFTFIFSGSAERLKSVLPNFWVYVEISHNLH